jgi:hypothetical protein
MLALGDPIQIGGQAPQHAARTRSCAGRTAMRNSRSPNTYENTSELASTTAARGPLEGRPMTGEARMDVLMISAISGAD